MKISFLLPLLGVVMLNAPSHSIEISTCAYKPGGPLPKSMTFCQSDQNPRCLYPRESGAGTSEIIFPAYTISKLPEKTKAVVWILYDETSPFTHMFGGQKIKNGTQGLYLSQQHTYPIPTGYFLQEAFKRTSHDADPFIVIQAPPANPFPNPHIYTLKVYALTGKFMDSTDWKNLKNEIMKNGNNGLFFRNNWLVSSQIFEAEYASYILDEGSISGTF